MIRINLLQPRKRIIPFSRVKTATVAVMLSLALHGGARIIDGRLAKPGQLGEVFLVFTNKPKLDATRQGICTATLIHERLLLTAAHCADGVESVPVRVENSSDVYGVEEPGAVTGEVESYGAYGVWVERTKAKDAVGRQAHDIAYLVLKNPVNGLKPAKFSYVESESDLAAKKELPVLLVGYGIRSIVAPENLERGLIGRKAYSEGKIDDVLNGRFIRKGLFGNVNSGDSGGPVFVKKGDARELVAIMSSASIEATTDIARWGIFTPLRKEHLCWVQSDSRIDLGLDCEEDHWTRPFANRQP